MPALPFSIITPIWPWEQFQALIPHPLNHQGLYGERCKSE